MTNSRRKARQAVLEALYEMELGRSTLDESIAGSLEEHDFTEPLQAFIREAVTTVHQRRREIDDRLRPLLRGYDFARLAAIDRNLLRLGAYELLFLPDMPPAVTINEVVEIAKRYSTAESGKFVNGVLGKLLRDTPKVDWQAPIAIDDPEPAIDEPEIETIEVAENSPELEQAKRLGAWTIKAEF